MAMQSYPLIGVDRSGNKYDREMIGYNEGNAAERLLDTDHRFIQIQSGNKNMKGRGSLYGKTVKIRRGEEERVSGGGNAFGDALEETQRRTAEMVLNEFKRKGLRLDIEVVGEDEESLMVQPQGKLTESDRQTLLENRDSIMAVLRERRNAEQKQFPTVRGARLALLKRVSPDLPSPFKRRDVDAALTKIGEGQLCDVPGAVTNAISYALSTGFFVAVSRGLYKAAEPPQAQAPPLPIPVIPAPTPEAVRTPQDGIAAQFAEQLRALDRQPPAAPPLAEVPVQGVKIKAPSNGLDHELSQTPELTKLLTTLASHTAVDTVEGSEAKTIRSALATFQNSMLQAIEGLEVALRPTLERMENMERAQGAIRRLLSTTTC